MDLTSLDVAHRCCFDSVSLIQSPVFDHPDVHLKIAPIPQVLASDFWKCPFNIGLFERHKLLFSFNMTVKIEQADGRVPQEEFEFFLKGKVNIYV